MTTIQTRCPSCQTTFHVLAEQANKWVRCANCQGTFQVRPNVAIPEMPAPAPIEPNAAPWEMPAPAVSEPSWPVEPPEPSRADPGEGGTKAIGTLVFVIVAVVFGVLRGMSRSGSESYSVNPPGFDASAQQRAIDEILRGLDAKVEAEIPANPGREGVKKDADDPALMQALRDNPEAVLALLRARELALRMRDPEAAEAAAAELARIATEETVPILVEGLDSRQARVRRHCLDGLERLRSPRSAAGVARLLPSSDGEQAVKVLHAIGPRAESEVRPYLRHAGATVRLRACRVLEKIGSAASLADLRSREDDENNDVRAAASAARAAIEKVETRK